MGDRNYYCLCDSNCKFPTMTTEQILAAIQQAAKDGLVYNPDAAVVTKVKELNGGQALTFWVGTQAQYNAVSVKDPYCHYIITDKKNSDLSGAVAAAVEAAEEALRTASDAQTAANEALDKANGTPVFYYSETEPTEWKNGDIWLQPAEG